LFLQVQAVVVMVVALTKKAAVAVVLAVCVAQ
jgi:hypothetical protein